MLLTQLTFITGVNKEPLTDRTAALAMSSLTYDREREERHANLARRWTLGLLLTGALMIGTGLQLDVQYAVYALIVIGIFILLAGGVVGSGFWRPSVHHQRRMRDFLIQAPACVFKPADDDKSRERGYWDQLIESIPDPTGSTDKRYGWKLLAKEMQRRTTLGEILTGMIARELTLTLPHLEYRYLSEEYVYSELYPDNGPLWKQRAKEFGVELYETYLAFHPEASLVTN